MNEQTIENCPFCGGDCYPMGVFRYKVRCMMCEYESGESPTAVETFEAHNRVARAVQKDNAKPLREKLKDAGMTLPPGYDGSEIFD